MSRTVLIAPIQKLTQVTMKKIKNKRVGALQIFSLVSVEADPMSHI
jgi:hypothetical protein